MTYQLGVDLGTTYTAAAVRHDDGVAMLGLGNRAMQIPSVLYLQRDGGFLVGEAAEARAAAEPDRVAREFKRRIGDPVPIIVGGTPLSAELLTARLLAWVVALATEREGAAPNAITVSYPANWGRYKTDLLQQVFTLADLADVSTCTEPEAAAVAYASRRQVEDGGCLAVYDLGGGTFDAAVLRNSGGQFTLIGAPEGIEHLGGVDFDEAVFQHVVRSAGVDRSELDFDDPAAIRGLERLRRDCVVAKESLSTDTEAVIAVTLGSLDTVVRLTRSEFEDLIRPALEETVAAMRRVLRSAGVDAAEIAAIVLVGGSSRIPLVSELLAAAFGRPLALDVHPKHDIATGAALLAGPPVVLPAQAAVAGPNADTATGPVASGRAEAVTATVPTQRPDGPPRPVRGRVSRRGAWLVAAAAAVVVLVVLGIVLFSGGDSGTPAAKKSTQQLTVPPPSSNHAVSTSSPTALAPQGPPIPRDVLLWTATRGGHVEIWAAKTNPTGVPYQFLKTEDIDGQVISRDRRTIAYLQNKPVTIWIAGSYGRPAHRLFGTSGAKCPLPSRPTFNYDGTKLAVICNVAKDRAELYLVNLQGQFLSTRPLADGHIGDVTFSKNGDLAFWQACNGQELFARLAKISSAAAPGTPPTPLTKCIGANDPTYSPDGDAIAFTARIPTGKIHDANIWVYSLLTGKLTQLTTSTQPDQDPSWSPDGTQIAYKHGPSGNGDIWVLTVNGKDHNPTPLTSNSIPETVPSWSTR